ncbi:MAG: OmpW family outer membrane protein [Ferruginibacter sp.]|jgi:outer membrane protein W
MRKIPGLLCLVLFTATAFAQNDETAKKQVFKKFKVDVSLGYAKPESSETDGGVLFAIEPKYAIIDQIAVGLRMEAAVTAKIDNVGDDSKAKANVSYLLTGDYYFNNNKFRPFGGLGAGLFTFASVDTNTASAADVPIDSKFGFMARAGFEYGHLRLGLEYNFVSDKAGYFGIKLGACIGGGRK